MGRWWFCGLILVVGYLWLGFDVEGYPVVDLVVRLPGQPKIGFRQFSGYVEVNVNAGRGLFYYFVEAEEDPNRKPLTLWLNGGPRCSSIGGGAFTELGSFFHSGDGLGLRRNSKSWNEGFIFLMLFWLNYLIFILTSDLEFNFPPFSPYLIASNILFVESPAGVGWSCSNRSSDYTCGDASTAMDMHVYTLRWFEKFSEFKSRELFLTGESYADFIVDGGAEIPDEDDGRRIHRCPLLPREDDQEDVEALERSIQARYARSSHTEYDEETTEVEQQALLPSVRDPKLWMIGREREVAVCLMQKYIDKGSELQIQSVIALDHLKNYIYIEADKEAHVKEACKGLRNIYAMKVMLVPIREMTDVLSVESKAIDLARDTWVRMKIGTYKGDLAKVVDVDNVRQKVTVKLIPRIDLQALANKLEGREFVKKKAFVPPPRFMNVEEARELHIRVERGRDAMTGDYFENIGGMLFKDGFLYKTVSMKSISSQNIQPTFDELEKFRTPGENGDGDMSSLSTLFANRKKGHFMKGDAVIVIKGDLKNLKGWVEKVKE
ncbi:hypothetical protein L1049_026873 [Liquidambar formosana]|uniref:Uncharacterized protein n=1 Tax=Liquidambar formosana TaxID=63359 RepID=A0AAP0NEI2_LIQFO